MAASMTDDVIPPAVRQFLTAHIPTVAHLEALLLIRAAPDEAWTVERIAQRLYVQPAQAASILAALEAHGLLEYHGEHGRMYCYKAQTHDLRAAVDLVAQTYRERLVPVTHFIHAQDRSSVQRFADGFRWRRDD
jgi:hypothetical protein